MADSTKVEEIEEIVADQQEDIIEDVSVKEDDENEMENESYEESEQEEESLVSHLYELMTNSQGINVTEALLKVSENLEKTNKILYKMLQIMSQHMAK